jgi:DNA-binding transcriptional MerR regulator
MPGYTLRMRDLVQRSGVSAPTIHFYGQQGLLPAARKTAGNQARYPEDTVSRVVWVRAVQAELRLSLRSIRSILERRGEIPVEEIRALQALGSLVDDPNPAVAADDLASVTERLGASDVATLTELGVIAGTAAVSNSDLRLLEVVAAMRAAGFTDEAGFHVESIAVYRDSVERLVGDELTRIVEPVLSRHDPETLHELVRRGLPLVNQLLSIFHYRAVQAETRRWLELERAESEPVTA